MTEPSTSDQSFDNLSTAQTEIAVAVAAGVSVTEASRAAGIDRSTVYEWTSSQPAFVDAIEEARQNYIENLRDQLRSMSAKALSRIESLIDDPKTPPAVALRAALAVLQRPRFPAQSWSLPEPVYTAEEEQCANQFASLEAEYKALSRESKLRKPTESDKSRANHPPANCAPDTIRRGPTNVATSPAPPPKTPRNARCPCGSGKKYKRCCGAGAPPVLGNVA